MRESPSKLLDAESRLSVLMALETIEACNAGVFAQLSTNPTAFAARKELAAYGDRVTRLDILLLAILRALDGAVRPLRKDAPQQFARRMQTLADECYSLAKQMGLLEAPKPLEAGPAVEPDPDVEKLADEAWSDFCRSADAPGATPGSASRG